MLGSGPSEFHIGSSVRASINIPSYSLIGLPACVQRAFGVVLPHEDCPPWNRTRARRLLRTRFDRSYSLYTHKKIEHFFKSLNVGRSRTGAYSRQRRQMLVADGDLPQETAPKYASIQPSKEATLLQANPPMNRSAIFAPSAGQNEESRSAFSQTGAFTSTNGLALTSLPQIRSESAALQSPPLEARTLSVVNTTSL